MDATRAGELARQWSAEGCVVVPGIYDPARVERLRGICESILQQWRVRNPETGQPGGGAGGGDDATVMRHLNHPGYFDGNAEALGVVLNAVADDAVLDVARAILQEEPLFRCTSLFFNPLHTSKDGDWHRDSQFMTKTDEAEKAMLARDAEASSTSIQMQIALVPSDDIEVVPGSHRRWDTDAEYYIRKADGGERKRSNEMPGAVRIALQPGDAVLFNPSGLHRGRYHANRLRRTFMLTFTKTSQPFDDYFSRQPWFLTVGYLEVPGLKPAARAFFERFVATYADHWREAEAVRQTTG